MQDKFFECAVCPFSSKCNKKWPYAGISNSSFSETPLTLPAAKPIMVNGEIQTTYSPDSLAIETGAAKRIYELLYYALFMES